MEDWCRLYNTQLHFNALGYQPPAPAAMVGLTPYQVAPRLTEGILQILGQVDDVYHALMNEREKAEYSTHRLNIGDEVTWDGIQKQGWE